MDVVGVETPKLRFFYNRFLLNRPGFAGKITLTFTINPMGVIVANKITASTTGYSEFDEAILKAVSSFVFKPGNFRNTTVTIPWTFSE